MRLALYEPEIPQNTGTLLRLGACLGIPVDIIEPCGYLWVDHKLKRAGMDYLTLATLQRHASWQRFLETKGNQRLILLDGASSTSFLDFTFEKNDILVLGKESSGVPPQVAAQMDHKVAIPMTPGCRSLNVAVAGALVLSEALRQTNLFPLLISFQEINP